jgi:hypothetical protein
MSGIGETLLRRDENLWGADHKVMLALKTLRFQLLAKVMLTLVRIKDLARTVDYRFF